MSLVDDVITRLRAQAPSFGNRVSGAAEFNAALRDPESTTGLTKPAAFVVPTSERAQTEALGRLLHLVVDETVSIMLLISNSVDTRGHAAATSAEALRNELIAALHGWAPDGAHKQFSYTGGQFVDMTRDAFWWQCDFATERSF